MGIYRPRHLPDTRSIWMGRDIFDTQGLFGDGLGVHPLDFAYDTFVPGMAKRGGTTVFAAAPIIQGKLAGGTGDVLSCSSGSRFGNPTTPTFQTADFHQGSVAFWITPEWAGNDGLRHELLRLSSYSMYLYKEADGVLWGQFGDGTGVNVSGWLPGVRHFVVVRWDTKKTLDGTNYVCISVDDVHTFGGAAAVLPPAPQDTNYIGSYLAGPDSAGAIIEGLTLYRRVLYDGTYGVPATFNASGPIDEIAAMHAAGVGQDPCLVTGSWDVVFCLPTNATEGALTSGNGNAWSHPHTSNMLNRWTLDDAFYGGGQWGVAFNGTNTLGDAGSGATLDDLPSGANFQVEGWYRADAATPTDMGIIGKTSGIGGNGWYIWINDLDDCLWGTVRHATTSANVTVARIVRDGKWHHFVLDYVSATKTIRMATDGKWGSSDVSTGAYSSDAAENLNFGFTNWYRLTGALGWFRLHNHQHYTSGTDFVPPREFPGADAGTVEAWSFNDGSGATAVATVTVPGNNCALTNHTWEQQWDDVLTPVIPTVLEQDGVTSYVDCGSGATLDDLPNAGSVTWEGWIYPRTTGEGGFGHIYAKGTNGSGGYRAYIANSPTAMQFQVDFATTDINYICSGMPNFLNAWHHLAITFNAGDVKIRVWLDGILAGTSAAGVGAYVSDAATNFIIGGNMSGAASFNGNRGWFRISNTLRYTANFVPPSRANPPATDGNTVEQWNFRDGAGTTVVASVTTPGNNGTITMGTGRWWNVPDMVTDSSGSRIYQWGYALGSDSASDGVHQHKASLTAGANYVARVPIRYEADKRARPQVVIYDETNGAAISTFRGPFLTGTHDGGAAHAHLHDSTAPYWPYSLVGGTVYNITDGSSGAITAAGTQITATLAGGGSNDWNNGEVYFIVPPVRWVWVESFCFELPTIARNGVAADCTHISVRLLNSAGLGVVYWEQVELLSNLVDNPSQDIGAGVPWIPSGWTNFGLDAGDTQAEATIVHSGAGSMRWNAGASVGELVLVDTGIAAGKFVGMGYWHQGDGTSYLSLEFSNTSNGLIQFSTTRTYLNVSLNPSWQVLFGVGRITGGTGRVLHGPGGGAVNPRYTDDVWVVLCDDVFLTTTPASAANSLETTGLRVDGQDLCSQVPTVGYLHPTVGWIRWRWTPRHSAAQFDRYASTSSMPDLFWMWGDANNYLAVETIAANTLRLWVTANGVNASTNWDCTGALVAGTTYLMEVRWINDWFAFYVNGVAVAAVTVGPMIVAPVNLFWGCSAGAASEADATYAAP